MFNPLLIYIFYTNLKKGTSPRAKKTWTIYISCHVPDVNWNELPE